MKEKWTIAVAIDNGLSATKAVWRDPEGFAHLLEMGPELKEMRESDIEDSGLSKGHPLQDAWVTIPGSSTKTSSTVALGLKAQQMQGRPPFQESKYGPAVYKIAAIVGAVAQELDTTSLVLHLGTLLPYVEYRDRQRFESLVVETLKDFSFRGTQLKVQVDEMYIAPEGAGVAESYAVDFEDEFTSQDTLILVLGHRDVSRLPYRKGTYLEQTGAKIGFAFFVEDVCKESSLNLDANARAIATSYIYKARWDDSYLDRLAGLAVKGRELKHKATEIGRVIEQAKYRYLTSLLEHVNDIGAFLHEADRVLISGGPTPYWLEDLKEYFDDYPKLAGQPLVYEQSYERIAALLGTQDEAMYPRLGDVVGLFDRLVYEADLETYLHSQKPAQTKVKASQGVAAPTQAETEAKPEAITNGHAKPALPNFGATKTTKPKASRSRAK